jgi:hypothetical protein
MAKFIDVTPRRLQQLVQEGIVPKAGRDRYPVFAVNIAYIRYLRDRLQSPDLSDSEFRKAKLAKLLSEREQIELAMQITRSERIPIDEVLTATNLIFGFISGTLKANRGKVLTKAVINEIFAEWRAGADDLRNQSDLANGQTAADRPPGLPWPDGPV